MKTDARTYSKFTGDQISQDWLVLHWHFHATSKWVSS